MWSAVISQLKKWEEGLVSNMPQVRSFISAKKKEKDQKEVIGNIIKAQAAKSRLSKENSVVETRLYYEKGLDKYYGLLELGEKYGVFKRVANRYEIGEKKVYPKNIYENPEEYFTPEVLQALDECAKKEYSYGS